MGEQSQELASDPSFVLDVGVVSQSEEVQLSNQVAIDLVQFRPRAISEFKILLSVEFTFLRKLLENLDEQSQPFFLEFHKEENSQVAKLSFYTNDRSFLVEKNVYKAEIPMQTEQTFSYLYKGNLNFVKFLKRILGLGQGAFGLDVKNQFVYHREFKDETGVKGSLIMFFSNDQIEDEILN